MEVMTHNTQLLIATERERWLKLHIEGGISIKELSLRSGFSRDTLHRWKRTYLVEGLAGLQEKSRAHQTYPNATRQDIVEGIRRLRKTTPRFGAKKIAMRLKKEGVSINWRTVHKVLVKEKLVSTRKRLKTKTKWKREAVFPGELMEIDVVYARKYKGNWLYQFSAIDNATRWKYSWIAREQTNQNSVLFLKKLVEAAPFRVMGVKTDNGSIFTNYYVGYRKSSDPMNPKIHAFDRACDEMNIVHYLIDPGKPAQNGKIERSHRTDREEFWSRFQSSSLTATQRKLTDYIKWYNEDREHLGINGLTPVEMLKKCQI